MKPSVSMCLARAVFVFASPLVACGGGGGTSSDSTPDARGPDALGPDAAMLAAPDLRFQWVGVAPSYDVVLITNQPYYGSGGSQRTNGGGAGQYVWSPLQLSVDGLLPNSYSWDVAAFSPTAIVQPVSSIVRAGKVASLDTDLAVDLGSSGVVTSLDIISDAYAYVVQGAANEVYAPTSFDISRANLDAKIASEAATGHVVTALTASPTAGMVRGYAFARGGDATAYQTKVLDATPTNLGAQATTLAAGGYVVTAFGHIADDVMILVGTRAPSAGARTVTVRTGAEDMQPNLSAGDAIVAWIFQTGSPSSTIVLER